MDDYTAKITLDGEEFDLLLSTEATRLIAAKYGGLDNLGEKLLKSENMELALEEVCWLVATLANAPLKKHNFKEPNAQKQLLTAEAVGILSTPLELADYKDAIMVALTRGTKRSVQSESDGSKNGQAG